MPLDVNRKRAGALRQHVRFRSKADMCAAKGHVRFTPKADMCSATVNVR